ncbi:LUD domain-containing protein [Natronorubrum daqingense]|uniref:(4Fe-4S)-binding protein n=1 Tax=Natronorubrum daqingense TaxID=588898 RepID=A0A1N6Y4D0_9EURY|nr:LUD domain-containing protein [Natronorubrum daqingense]APX95783.1 (4Fe-4S)-binding protein [Natronorubrum daqingense]SIR09525.1 iron-sulfur cluster-binding protein [Natronorubrum daqingense]
MAERTQPPRSRDEKAAHIRHLLETEGEAVHAQSSSSNARRYDVYEETPTLEDRRSEARAIKEDAIDRLPSLIETVREAVEANGGTVYVADDAADANAYVADVVDHNSGGSNAKSDASATNVSATRANDAAPTVVKSKSMTTEEIDLNDALETAGVEVHETDLGEWVLQVADDTPSHIVGPAMHFTREEITELITERFDPDESVETAEELTRFARDYLGERIREADVGVTGANFVVAETGTMALVTNEGNARKCAVTPDTHVAIAGVEKLIPTVSDLEPFVDIIAKSATGQPISQYVTMLSPPTESPTLAFESDEPISSTRSTDESEEPNANPDRDFHLVLLDNGRMEMREDEQLRETLYCIRCGACSNSCSNFQAVGGHGFGGETYSGGIATGWEAGVHGQDSAAEFNDLCTGCTRCVDACPVKIDIPWINTVVRDRINRDEEPPAYDSLVDGLTPDAEGGGLNLGKRFFGNIATAARLSSATAPISNWIADTPPARALLERTLGIDRRRDLPTFQRESLVEWFEARGGIEASRRRANEAQERGGTADVEREAVLYADVYTNYVDTERGKAAVRTLETLGVPVRVPDLPESGRAPLSQGMVATADRQASRFYGAIAEDLDAGRDLVVVEPSDLAAFHREYERFLPEASFERVRDNSYEVCEYVYGLLENGADPSLLETGAEAAVGDGTAAGEPIAYHAHCQQRTLDLEGPTLAVLERCGYEPTTSSVECCGMAGSFGYKREYYELSMTVGDRLASEVESAETVVASGTSCGDQLESLLERSVPHPIELLAPRR